MYLYAIEYRNIPSGVKYKHKERSFTTGLHGVSLLDTELNLSLARICNPCPNLYLHCYARIANPREQKVRHGLQNRTSRKLTLIANRRER